jgi:hypothetical protein
MLYTAYVGREHVEAGDSLADLLAVLSEIVDATVPEDVAVWQGNRLVVVVHPDGSQTWLRPELLFAAANAA